MSVWGAPGRPQEAMGTKGTFPCPLSPADAVPVNSQCRDLEDSLAQKARLVFLGPR